jgi:hypothetical protein
VVGRLLEIAAAFGGWWLRAALHQDAARAAADMRQARARALALARARVLAHRARLAPVAARLLCRCVA